MSTIQGGEAGVPLHESLAADLRHAVAAGTHPPGSTLPTARDLARERGVHENTVLRAYRALHAEGLIDLRRSRGAVVLAQPDYRRLDEIVGQLLDEAARQGLSVGGLLALVARHAAAR